jgi:hypothetical protein
MEKCPLSILDRFQGKRRLLIRRMSEDSDFYALCQDYEICVKALQYWRRSGEPEADARQAEYRRLVRELETEITAELKSWELRQRD